MKKLLIIFSLIDFSQSSKLVVLHPSSLQEKIDTVFGEETGFIRNSLGNFGDFQYGVTLKGRVHYPITNQDGCREFTENDFNGEHLKEASIDGHA